MWHNEEPRRIICRSHSRQGHISFFATQWKFITGKPVTPPLGTCHAQLEKAVEVLNGEIKRNGHWLMPPGGRRTCQ
jgi:hypothetical protein